MPDDFYNKVMDEVNDGVTSNEIEQEFDIEAEGYNDADDLITDMQDLGYTVDRYERNDDIFYRKDDDVQDHFSLDMGDGTYLFSVISDTHLGSEADKVEELNDFYDRVADRDIDVVFHAGDISDGTVTGSGGRGMYRGHINHLHPEAIGWQRLEDYVVENYPEREGVKTLFIEGNHDRQLWAETGKRFGKALDNRRDDLKYIGDCFANIDLGDFDMDLVHPSGGIPYCYTGETRVLTKNHGFVRFDEVPILVNRVGDIQVATFNMETGEMEFQKPGEFVITDADEFVEFNGQSLDLKVTANHRMIARKNGSHHENQGDWQIMEAQDMADDFVRQKFDIPKSAGWSGKRIESFELEATHPNGENITIDGDSFMKLMGWFISEGWVKNNDRGRIHFSQHPEKQERIVEELEESGLTIATRKDKVKTTNKALAAWLDEHAGKGAGKKRVPQIVKNASSEQINTFLETLFAGDGHTEDGKLKSYTTTSKQLAHDVIELLAKTGKSGTLREHESDYDLNGYSGTSHKYVVSVSNTKKGSNPSLCTEPTKTRETRKAYCFTVPNETLFVMRNGKTAFSGNTKSYRAQTWLRNKNEEDKADITVLGHLHEFLTGQMEGSRVIYPGAWQGQSPFLDRQGVKAGRAGGYIIEAEIEDGEIRRWLPEQITYPLEYNTTVETGDLEEILEE